MNSIPYGRQYITQQDIDAVIKVLRADYLTQGPKIPEFEKAFAAHVGARHAVAVANGTAALHLCILALGVQPGDKVISTPITFAASANCVRYAGGEVIFADIDPQTYLLDIARVDALLKAAPTGTYKGIIPVDFAGRAVDMEAFRKLANQYGCWIIEDGCHAIGGYLTDSKGKKQLCGNGNFADLTTFSFHPVKHIATGEGGMVTTNDEILYRKLQTLRTHGIIKDNTLFQNSAEIAIGNQREARIPRQEAYPKWYYEMQELGFNYRLTDFQAALGKSQLERANKGLARRREIAQTYFEAFCNLSFIKGQSGVVKGHAYHLYVIEVEKRKALYEYLRDNNIFTQIHYIPVHLMPYYQKFGWKTGDMPVAEEYYARCISLPMYPTLNDDEQQYVIAKVKEFYE
jgi:UDP-4-amino-4,6-dideoxy-N-acetyl-beta-L-altrosamine transaminase